jgi:hypothetical protein
MPDPMPGTEYVVVMHKRFLMMYDDYVVGHYPTKDEAETVCKKLSLIAPWGASYSVEQRIKGG